MSHSYYECMVSNDVWLLIILAEGKSLSGVRCQYDLNNAREFVRKQVDQEQNFNEDGYIIYTYRRV